MSDIHMPALEIGFYHPTETFHAIREHISVMDTNQSIDGSDGALIALFGPSLCAGATGEEVAETRRQAQLFIAAEDLLAACRSVIATLEEAQREWQTVPELYAPEWTHPLKRQADSLRETVAKAGGEPR